MQANACEIQELNTVEIEEVSGGFLPVALFLFDVAIWAYDGYKLGQITK
jgi:hypothetical protein